MSTDADSVMGVGLVYFVRARLAAGEPFSTVVEWLVAERHWRSGREGAEKWLNTVARLSAPNREHPAISRAVAAKMALPGKCSTCGRDAINEDSDRCNLCWEVERRLRDYIKSPGGMAFAKFVTGEADARPVVPVDAWPVVPADASIAKYLHQIGDKLVGRSITSVEVLGDRLTLIFEDGKKLPCLISVGDLETTLREPSRRFRHTPDGDGR